MDDREKERAKERKRETERLLVVVSTVKLLIAWSEVVPHQGIRSDAARNIRHDVIRVL